MNPDENRFCGACGSTLSMGLERRKLVTVLFCDIVGSTAMGEHLDPEAVRDIQERYFSAARTAIELHGGTVEKYIGDAVMAVFGLPAVREDDALRALRAALAIRSSIALLNESLATEFAEQIQVRIGVNSGQAVAGDPTARQHLISGDAVNVAARLEQRAAVGEILVGPLTAQLAGDMAALEACAPLDLKGKSEPLRAFRLIGTAQGADGAATRLVGRATELAQLVGLFEAAVASGHGQLCVVVGEPGVGKSELVRAAVDLVGDRARSLGGRCLPYGEGITYWPIHEIVMEAAGIGETNGPGEALAAIERLASGLSDARWIAERVALAAGLTDHGTASESELALAIRRWLGNICAARPLILVLDDLQWAEQPILDLARSLADLESPMLVVALARPELIESQPDWPSRMDLHPLSPDVIPDLAEQQLGGPISADLLKHLIDSTAGNPLFVKHLLESLRQQGQLAQLNGEWRLTAAGSQSTPPTLTALLMTRLEQLTQPEREALEAGAIEGERFHEAAVRDLLYRPGVSEAFDQLVDRGLIKPALAEFPASRAFAFQHLLLRDAAYSGLLLRKRSELHERYAEWLEAAAGERLTEYERIVAFHLESAWEALGGLGRGNRRAALAVRAHDHLARVGRRAIARGDVRGAVSLLDRAIRIDDELEPADADETVREIYGLALWEAGETKAARDALLQFCDDAERSGRNLRVLHGKLDMAALDMYVNPDVDLLYVEQLARTAIAAFEPVNDAGGLSKAWESLSDVDWISARFRRAGQRARIALRFARNAGDPRRGIRILSTIAMSVSLGPTPVPKALLEIDGFLAATVDHPETRAQILSFATTLHAEAGDFDKARQASREAVETFDRLGLRFKRAEHGQSEAMVEAYAGDWVAAERELRAACAALEEIGEESMLSTDEAMLGDALWHQGRFVEAITFAERSRDRAGRADVVSQVLWRVAKAKALASVGRSDEGVPLALEARQIARQTDVPHLGWDAEFAVAHVEVQRGNSKAAVRAYEQAASIADRKGNVVIAIQARRHARQSRDGT